MKCEMKGKGRWLEARVQTQWEMNARNCRQYIMTCDQPWDPSQVKVAAVGSKSRESSELCSLMDGISSVHVAEANSSLSTHRCLSDISNTLDDKERTSLDE